MHLARAIERANSAKVNKHSSKLRQVVCKFNSIDFGNASGGDFYMGDLEESLAEKLAMRRISMPLQSENAALRVLANADNTKGFSPRPNFAAC